MWAVLFALAVTARYDFYFGCERAGTAELSVDGGTYSWTSDLGEVRTSATAVVSPAWELVSAEGSRGGPMGPTSARADRAALPAGVLPALAFESWALERGGGCRTVFEEATGIVGQACAQVERSPAGSATLSGEKLGLRFVASYARGARVPEAYSVTTVGAHFVRQGAAPPCRKTEARPRPKLTVPAALAISAAHVERLAGLARAAAADGARCLIVARRFDDAARGAGYASRVRVGWVGHEGQLTMHAWNEVRLGGRWVAVDPALDEVPARSPRQIIGLPLTDVESQLATGAALGLELSPVRGPSRP